MLRLALKIYRRHILWLLKFQKLLKFLNNWRRFITQIKFYYISLDWKNYVEPPFYAVNTLNVLNNKIKKYIFVRYIVNIKYLLYYLTLVILNYHKKKCKYQFYKTIAFDLQQS